MTDVTELDLLRPLGKVDPPSQETMREAAALLSAETNLTPSPPRRFGTRNLIIGGGAVAAAAAVFAVVTLVGSTTEAPEQNSAQQNSAQQDRSLRDVVLAALDSNATSILHVTMTTVNKRTPVPLVADLWYSSAQPKAGQSLTVRNILEPSSSTFEQDASETYVFPGVGQPPTNCSLLQVQYKHRMWTKHVGDCPFLSEPQLDLKQEIAEGQWHRVPGQTTVDGQVAVQYTQETDGNSKGIGNSSQTLWINASTGLPISNETKDFTADGTVDSTVTVAFSFLPNTDQNRAQLTVPIPAGFTQVSEFPPTRH